MSDTVNPLKDQIVAAIRSVFDPEIPVNIYDLGLIYGIEISHDGKVAIRMTLTSPNCPVAEMLPRQVRDKVGEIPGVIDADVEIVWEPTWTREMMSEAAQLELEMMGIAGPSHLHKPHFTDVTFGRTTKRDVER